MAALNEIVLALNSFLKPEEFQDSSLNGLQVQSPNSKISRVGVAVDAGRSVMESAIAQRCDLLIVHHGILWGEEQAIANSFGEKIALLMHNGCSLYASHLPLDAHATHGNNVLLAKFFNLEVLHGFAKIGGQHIGVVAKSVTKLPREAFITRATQLIGATSPLLLPFGPAEIQKVGIVSGSGASAIAEASSLGLDLLLSGEPKQHAYHDCKEVALNALFAGHYATETFGVCALGEKLSTDFGIESVFVDEPTGI